MFILRKNQGTHLLRITQLAGSDGCITCRYRSRLSELIANSMMAYDMSMSSSSGKNHTSQGRESWIDADPIFSSRLGDGVPTSSRWWKAILSQPSVAKADYPLKVSSFPIQHPLAPVPPIQKQTTTASLPTISSPFLSSNLPCHPRPIDHHAQRGRKSRGNSTLRDSQLVPRRAVDPTAALPHRAAIPRRWVGGKAAPSARRVTVPVAEASMFT